MAGMIYLSGYSPLGIVPLAAGVGLGLILAGLAGRFQVALSKQLILLTLLLACIAVLSEHAFIYGDFRQQWRESRQSPQVAMFRSETPPSLVEFFSSEATPERIGL